MSHYRRSRAPGATFFFTVVAFRRQPILCDAPLRAALRDAIRRVRSERPFTIDAWVLLPDHLHCIWTLPLNDADFGLRWNLIKRHTVRACGDLYHRSEPGRVRIHAHALAEGLHCGYWEFVGWVERSETHQSILTIGA